MQSIGELVRSLRLKGGYPLRKIAAMLDIDQAILSKMERGQRKFKKDQVIKLAGYFNYDKKEMLINFLSDQVIGGIDNEDFAMEVLQVAEEKIAYQRKSKLSRSDIISKMNGYFKKENRILTVWIFGSFSREKEEVFNDIDLMIEFNEDQSLSLFDLADMQFNLESLTGINIDIVEKGCIKTFAWKNAKKDLRIIYDRNR